MRILLVSPPITHLARHDRGGWDIEQDDFGKYPPLGLLYLASNLARRDAHELRLIDSVGQGLTHADLERELIAFQPDLVAISVCTVILYDCVLIARMARRHAPGAHLCFGGPHVTDFPDEALALPEVDSVVRGEGEAAFAALVDRLATGRSPEGIPGLSTRAARRTGELGTVDDVDALRFPDRSLLPRNVYYNAVGLERAEFTSMITSRGCPMRCTFCATLHKEYRPRSVASILAEMEAIAAAGYREIFFQDDSFNLQPARVKELCRELVRRGPKLRWSFKGRAANFDEELAELAAAAGCFQAHFGVETGAQAGLDALKKDVTVAQLEQAFAAAHRHGIRTIADFMIGLPFERTRADILANARRLHRLDPTYAQFNVFQPFPRTELFRAGEAKGLFTEKRWTDWMRDPTPEFEKDIWPEYFTRAELSAILREAYHRFYFRPRYVWRSVRELRNWTDIRNKLAGVRTLLRPRMG